MNMGIVNPGQLVVYDEIEPELKEQLERLARDTGKNESELVREGVLLLLGKFDPISIETMLNRIASLERRYKRVERNLNELDNRL